MAAVETAVEAAVLTAVMAASTVAGRRQLHDTAAGLGEHRDRGDGDVIVTHPVILDIKSFGLSLLLFTSFCRPSLLISFLLTTQLSVSPIWPHLSPACLPSPMLTSCQLLCRLRQTYPQISTNSST
jgi:hypothetical protein